MKAVRTLKSKGSTLRVASAVVSLGAVAGGAAFVGLPSTVLRAVSVVAVDEPSAGLRAVAARGAATFAVSKPVIARAAASLNGTDIIAPAPALADRFGVVIGLSGAQSGLSRLADALASSVKARAGDGVVEIEAEAGDPARATRIAGAMAEALVLEEEAASTTAARRAETAAAAKLETLRAAARDAHQRLAALGGTEADPVLALASAVNATRAAEARLSAVRAVIAAGTPPLGAGAELPPSAASLQQTYWDLKKQLDRAAETLGERHTTVIALRDGVSRASTNLTAEWRRIDHAAEADVTLARGREAGLRKAGATLDPTKRAAIDDARRNASAADAAVARATAAATPVATAPFPYRVVPQAAAPASVIGLSVWQRALAAALAAGVGAALVLLRGRRRPSGGKLAETADTLVEPTMRPSHDASSERRPAATPAARDRAVADHDFFEQAPRRAASVGDEPDHLDERTDAMPFESLSFDLDDGSARPAGRLDPDLLDALRAIAADLRGLETHRGVATIMVASNTAAADTGTIALALGKAAAGLGHRVLVVECEHARAALAEAVAPHGEPILIDAFGPLRVALPAESADDLYLAPALRDGARIAGALARNTRTELVDDLASAFDAVVIDAGRAADAVASGWSADAYIRVGRFASLRDDEHFLALLGAPGETLLGTVAAGRFVVPDIASPAPVPVRHSAPDRPAGRPALRAVDGGRDERTAPRPAAAPLNAAPRRRIAGR